MYEYNQAGDGYVIMTNGNQHVAEIHTRQDGTHTLIEITVNQNKPKEIMLVSVCNGETQLDSDLPKSCEWVVDELTSIVPAALESISRVESSEVEITQQGASTAYRIDRGSVYLGGFSYVRTGQIVTIVATTDDWHPIMQMRLDLDTRAVTYDLPSNPHNKWVIDNKDAIVQTVLNRLGV